MPPGGLGCFCATGRRALAPAAGVRVSLPRPFPPGLREGQRGGASRPATNWDSNAVLCGTSQIPGTSTRANRAFAASLFESGAGRATDKSLRPRAFRLGFWRCPAAQVDHGKRVSAMGRAPASIRAGVAIKGESSAFGWPRRLSRTISSRDANDLKQNRRLPRITLNPHRFARGKF